MYDRLCQNLAVRQRSTHRKIFGCPSQASGCVQGRSWFRRRLRDRDRCLVKGHR